MNILIKTLVWYITRILVNDHVKEFVIEIGEWLGVTNRLGIYSSTRYKLQWCNPQKYKLGKRPLIKVKAYLKA